MYLTTGIEREMEKLVDQPVPSSLAGLVDILGGPLAAVQFLPRERGEHKGELYNPQTPSERQNAARVVQRYLDYERQGKRTSNREITPQNFNRIRAGAVQKLWSGTLAQMRRRGLRVRGEIELFDPSGRPAGTRSINAALTGDGLDNFLVAWADYIRVRGTLPQAAALFDDALMNYPSPAYNFPGARIDDGPDALKRDDFSISYAT